MIEADGVLLNPVQLHRLPIHVAQRYSVVVDTNLSTTTNYWLRAEMVTGCFTGDNPVLDPVTKAVVSYSGNTTIVPSNESIGWSDTSLVMTCQDMDEKMLVPAVQKPPPPATAMWRIDFSFGIGAHQLDRGMVNGSSWSPMADTTTLIKTVDGLNGKDLVGPHIREAWEVSGVVGPLGDLGQYAIGLSSDKVEVVDILLYSLDEGSHPFHLHGHQFVSCHPPRLFTTHY